MVAELNADLDTEESILINAVNTEARNQYTKSLPLGCYGQGIVICGGGYRYFTNAFILIRLLRRFGCELPIELWGTGPEEFGETMRNAAIPLGVTIRHPDKPLTANGGSKLPVGSRWQWVLKPHAIIYSRFAEVIFLDADSFPLRDPAFLFRSPQYREHGAVFWPDLGRMEPERKIWNIMSVPYRDEPEFETGQMVLDKRRCWEPLLLALWMNQKADCFYKHIWGDKDTFRFAWHKYGRTFGMPLFPIQILEVPGRAHGVGVMCQHDFDGNRLFQHRNMAKWDLLGINPQIPGYMFEKESFRYLDELRAQWNGRIRWQRPRKENYAAEEWKALLAMERELRKGFWLFEDQRPKELGCCGPMLEWSAVRQPHDWKMTENANTTAEYSRASVNIADASDKQNSEAFSNGDTGGQINSDSADPVMARKTELRCQEITFAMDSTLRLGANIGYYWWDLARFGKDAWQLHLTGENGRILRLIRQADGSWTGIFQKVKDKKTKPHLARIFRVTAQYRALRNLDFSERGQLPALIIKQQPSAPQPWRIANHAYGIGDAITGIYACMGAVKAGREVIYHTRFPQWLSRVQQAGLTIISDPPPAGTPDLNEDYSEQLRYGQNKTLWYSQYVCQRTGIIRQNSQKHTQNFTTEVVILNPGLSRRPSVNLRPKMRRLDFAKYVIIAPFAAWQARDWPQAAWRRLAWLLGEDGYEVVAIGTKREEERLIATFNKSNAYWAVDHSPEWIMDVMLGADAVIGLDSGMVHLAGLLKVRTICIHAHLPPKFLFSCAPTVKSITPRTKCVFCRWQPDRGFNEGCADACSALASVGPEQVMMALLEMTCKKRRS